MLILIGYERQKFITICSKILRQIMSLIGLLNTKNISEIIFFKNKDYYFHMIFKNLNCRKSKGYKWDYIQTDMTSLNIVYKKVSDLKCRKISIVTLDYPRETKLRCTEAKKENFWISKKRPDSKNKSSKKVVEKGKR